MLPCRQEQAARSQRTPHQAGQKVVRPGLALIWKRSGIVLATVPFSDRLYYSGSKITRPQVVRSWFVPNGSHNKVLEYSSDNLVFGTWNMELQTVHLLAVSDFWYLQNSASCFEFIVIFGRKTRFLGYRLLRFKDIKNPRQPKDAPRWAAYFTYQTLNSLINICGLKVMVCLKNRRFLKG